jgi:hypothetical protein
MADQTKEQLDARAKVNATAATAAGPGAGVAPAPTAPPDTLQAITETLQQMQTRLVPAGAAHATQGLDETQPGGVYIVRGVRVNANGRELNDDGSIKYPDQLRVNEFGQMV